MVFIPQSNKHPVIWAVLITELAVVFSCDSCALHLWADQRQKKPVFGCLSYANLLDGREEIVAGTGSKLILTTQSTNKIIEFLKLHLCFVKGKYHSKDQTHILMEDLPACGHSAFSMVAIHKSRKRLLLYVH